MSFSAEALRQLKLDIVNVKGGSHILHYQNKLSAVLSVSGIAYAREYSN